MKESFHLVNVRPIIVGMQGHNYAFPDCVKFLLENVGDTLPVDFWDIGALTGDTAVQVYNHGNTTGCEYCVSGYLAGREHTDFTFNALGYSYEYLSADEINADIDACRDKIAGYLDKGVAVLVKTNLNDIPEWNSDVGTYALITGYSDYCKKLSLLVWESATIGYEFDENSKLDLIFIGEKKADRSYEDILIRTIGQMPIWFNKKSDNDMYFGASAYRKWADDVESGRFNDEKLDLWGNYGVYACNLATNGGGPHKTYRKLAEIDTKYAVFKDISEQIKNCMPVVSETDGRNRLWAWLEEYNAGLDMGKVAEIMKDAEKRRIIAEEMRAYADKVDKAVEFMIKAVEAL